MNRLRLTISLSTLIALAACTRYSSNYTVPKLGSGNQTPGSTDNVVTGATTEIELQGSKVAGGESKYETVIKYAGATSAKTKLEKTSTGLSLTLNTLPVGKTDVLNVEVYEGDKLRFIARRNAVAVTKGNSKIEIADCLIQTAPWDGAASDAGCNWTVEEVK